MKSNPKRRAAAALPRVTLADVARESGVSTSTVAQILNGQPGYNAQTRQRISATAQRMGYRPNALGKALRSGKSMSIGVIASSINTPAQVVGMEAIEQAARQAGYITYLVGWSNTPIPEPRLRSLTELLDRRVDGIISMDTSDMEPEVSALFRTLPMPVVYVGRVPDHAQHVVRQERRPAIAALAQHLADLGHRRVALMASAWALAHPANKVGLVQQACAQHGIEVEVGSRWLTQPPTSADEVAAWDKEQAVLTAYELMRDAIRSGDLPTAVLASNDRTALAALAACHDEGVRVPQDISVVGFDGEPLGQIARPALTTLQQARGDIGQAAFQMLHALMQDPRAHVQNRDFPLQLVIRDSTGPAPNR